MTQAFDTAFQAVLTGHAGLSAIVGDRVWPEFIDGQTSVTLPCIIRLCGYSADQDLSNASPVLTLRAVFEVYADDRGELLDINEQLFACLNAYTGTLGSIPVRSMYLQSYEPVSIEKSPGQALYAAVITYGAFLDLQ